VNLESALRNIYGFGSAKALIDQGVHVPVPMPFVLLALSRSYSVCFCVLLVFSLRFLCVFFCFVGSMSTTTQLLLWSREWGDSKDPAEFLRRLATGAGRAVKYNHAVNSAASNFFSPLGLPKKCLGKLFSGGRCLICRCVLQRDMQAAHVYRNGKGDRKPPVCEVPDRFKEDELVYLCSACHFAYDRAKGGNIRRQFSRKAILARGCHPAMAHRAAPVLPSHLGNPKLVTCTDDDLLAKLSGQKWDVIFFAPGACRYNAAKQPIPEARAASKGWGLDQYRQLVREQQGKETKMVETVDERQIIPLLRDALEEL
jgi:hypothetical protein